MAGLVVTVGEDLQNASMVNAFVLLITTPKMEKNVYNANKPNDV